MHFWLRVARRSVALQSCANSRTGVSAAKPQPNRSRPRPRPRNRRTKDRGRGREGGRSRKFLAGCDDFQRADTRPTTAQLWRATLRLPPPAARSACFGKCAKRAVAARRKRQQAAAVQSLTSLHPIAGFWKKHVFVSARRFASPPANGEIEQYVFTLPTTPSARHPRRRARRCSRW